MILTTRDQRRQLERENLRWPKTLLPVPRVDWPPAMDSKLVDVWRSRTHLVQVFAETGAAEFRISVNRTAIVGDRWADGITWDDLQRIKCEIGFKDRDALELYPAARDVVNVANVRHLWILREPVGFGWRRK